MKKKKYKKFKTEILIIIAIISLTFLGVKKIEHAYIRFLSIVIAVFLNNFIHNLGYIIAAIVQGYTVEAASILFLNIYKEEGVYKLGNRSNLKGNLNIGGKVFVDVTCENFNRKAIAKIFLGGLLSNLIFGVLSGVIFIYIMEDNIKFILLCNIVIAFTYFLANLILKSNYTNSDGYLIYSLLKNSEAVNILMIQISLNEGIYPDYFNDKCLEEPNKITSDYNNTLIHYYRYLNLLSKGELEKAKIQINKVIEFDKKYDIRTVAGNFFTYTNEIFYYYAVIENNIEKAIKYYKENENIIRNNSLVSKAKALAAYEIKINKDLESGKIIFENTLRVLEKSNNNTLIIFERDLINKTLL